MMNAMAAMAQHPNLSSIIRSLQNAGERHCDPNIDLSKPALVTDSIASFEGVPVKRKVIILRSRGCRWCQVSGCSMCGFFGTTQQTVSAENYLAQIRFVLDTTEFSGYPVLCLFTAGSFLDEDEVPWHVAKTMMSKLGEIAPLRKVIIESRPEFVTPDKVSQLVDALQGKVLEIGIGLESANPDVLRYCINKGFSLQQYERAVQTIKSQNGRVLSYVLVKPPFLTEKEAWIDAVYSGEYAFACGSDAVSLEPMFIESGTLVDFIYRTGYLFDDSRYRPPWLWTVFEVARQLRHSYPDREVRIGCSEEVPRPYAAARNCGICTPRADQAILHYARTYDIRDLEIESCSCREKWTADLSASWNPLRLKDRVERFIVAFDGLIRPASPADLDEIMAVEESAWPEGTRATREAFIERLNVFPEGFLVAVLNKHIVGVLTSQRISFIPGQPASGWEKTTNGGFIGTTHQSEGNTLNVVSVGVAEGYQGRGIGSHLIKRAQQLATEQGLAYVVLDSRVPDYAQYHQQYTIQQYVSACAGDEALDRELRFYARLGFRMMSQNDIVAECMTCDLQSMNYGVRLVWKAS